MWIDRKVWTASVVKPGQCGQELGCQLQGLSEKLRIAVKEHRCGPNYGYWMLLKRKMCTSSFQDINSGVLRHEYGREIGNLIHSNLGLVVLSKRSTNGNFLQFRVRDYTRRNRYWKRRSEVEIALHAQEDLFNSATISGHLTFLASVPDNCLDHFGNNERGCALKRHFLYTSSVSNDDVFSGGSTLLLYLDMEW